MSCEFAVMNKKYPKFYICSVMLGERTPDVKNAAKYSCPHQRCCCGNTDTWRLTENAENCPVRLPGRAKTVLEDMPIGMEDVPPGEGEPEAAAPITAKRRGKKADRQAGA